MHEHILCGLNNLVEVMGWQSSNGYTLKSVNVLVAQLCPVVCDPRDCNPPGSSVHGIFQAGIQKWIFSTQGSTLGLLHCRQILYHLSHQGNLAMTYIHLTHSEPCLAHQRDSVDT